MMDGHGYTPRPSGSLQALAISARDDLSINMGNHDWKFGGLHGSK
jgi:hypothetical protein